MRHGYTHTHDTHTHPHTHISHVKYKILYSVAYMEMYILTIL